MSGADTIFALATPPGVSALAMIRLSGPGVLAALAALAPQEQMFKPRYATLATLTDPATNQKLDHALVTFFQGPHSFTGEDVAELSLHGGRAVVAGVMATLAALPNLRPAEPGEFTRRAFLNHKLDLTEAEAVADLIHAETTLQRAQALAQLGGSLKTLYDRWRDLAIHTAAYIAAHLDFPDEDLPTDLIDRIRPDLATLITEIAAHLDDGRVGEIVRDGARVVILGAPNVGKSSLLNALARREAAIVSPHAGTTRDTIDVHLDIQGFPVTLTDTAGLRLGALGTEAQDQIEAIGIARALDRAKGADLKIALFDAAALPALDPETRAYLDAQTIVVASKIDQVSSFPPVVDGHDVIGVSTQTGQGIEALLTRIRAHLYDNFAHADGAVITRARHRAALADAHAALVRAGVTSAPELVAEELRVATDALSRLSGRIDVEDLLDVIFRDFCIGK